jgi:hypothetical protein
MERKMLLGIKQRAEDLAREQAEHPQGQRAEREGEGSE